MYYGYSSREKILMADEEFIELLGFKTIGDVIRSKIGDTIKFENSKIYISLSDSTIEANYSKILLYTQKDDITIVKLSNIIITKNSVSKLQLNYQPIYLDINKISNEIGLSVDDYKLYLDSFIDQSIIDEKKLLAGDDKTIKNLITLSSTLKIPHVSVLLLKIQKSTPTERPYYIDEYYTKLALLTLKEPEKSQPKIIEKDTFSSDITEDKLDTKFTELINREKEKTKSVSEKSDLLDLNLDLDDDFLSLDDTTTIEPTPKTVKKESKKSDDSEEIILDDAPPLPINYNPKVAADELNLPVVLIEEFVEDFIEQAHHDKDHLLASYYQKDMDNIHELGHKLKGAASNLRINELADVLEEIQFCTDYSKLKPLFIKYWGLFKSLEKYMKQPKQR